MSCAVPTLVFASLGSEAWKTEKLKLLRRDLCVGGGKDLNVRRRESGSDPCVADRVPIYFELQSEGGKGPNF